MAEQTVELQKRFKIKNLCTWDLGIGESGMNIHIPTGRTVPVKGEDLDLLISNENKFLWGTGDGNHAKILILDEELRKYFGVDKQIILTKDKFDYMIELKTDDAFKSNLEKFVVATHEVKMIIEHFSKEKEFAKLSALRLKMIEEHTGQKINY